MAKYAMKRSAGLSRGPHAGQLFGPGEAVEVPDSVAFALGLKPVDETGEDKGDKGDEGEGDRDHEFFASDAAATTAADAGLVDADFEGVEPSGAGGGYTKADVEAVIESKNK